MLQKYSWAAIGRFFPWLESFVASSSCSPDSSSFSKENLFTKCPFHHSFPRHSFHPLPLLIVQTQYRRQQLKIPSKIQSSRATGVCAGGMPFGSVGAVRDVKQVILALAISLLLAPRGSVQEGWLSGAMGRRDVKACQFSISNQALLSREQKQDGTIFILKRNDSVCQFRHACTDHSSKPI